MFPCLQFELALNFIKIFISFFPEICPIFKGLNMLGLHARHTPSLFLSTEKAEKTPSLSRPLHEFPFQPGIGEGVVSLT